jgi:hypothetical protein
VAVKDGRHPTLVSRPRLDGHEHGGTIEAQRDYKDYVQGVSTRSVDDLVRAMGMTGISKS